MAPAGAGRGPPGPVRDQRRRRADGEPRRTRAGRAGSGPARSGAAAAPAARAGRLLPITQRLEPDVDALAAEGHGGRLRPHPPAGRERGAGSVPRTDAFGFPRPRRALLARLTAAVSLAAAHGLRVELTLFDGFQQFADLASSQAWAAAVLHPFAHDRRIAYADVRRTRSTAARRRTPVGRAHDPGGPAAARRTLVTASVTIDEGTAALERVRTALGPAGRPGLLGRPLLRRRRTRLSAAARRAAGRGARGGVRRRDRLLDLHGRLPRGRAGADPALPGGATRTTTWERSPMPR